MAVVLGNITLVEQEVPDSIPFGGEQRLAVKKLIGGARVIDALGIDSIPLRWSGRILPMGSQTALDRAQQIKALADAGLPIDLSWSSLSYSVVIRSFVPDFRFFEIPYTIECEVLEDRNATTVGTAQPGIDGLIMTDITAANGLSSIINNPTIASGMATLTSAISQVQSFAKATQAQINSVIAPLQAARQQVTTAITQVDNVLINAASFGGLLPNNPIAVNVAKFTAQLNAAVQQPNLLNLKGLLGRVAFNLTQIGTGTQSITVTGGNLFDLAAKFYGNVSGWTTIAKANNLTDPNIVGVQTLLIPPFRNDTGGVLNA